MEVIDEEGRLFGVVNVVDALVVLLVLAVVAAGVALVGGETPGTDEPDLASTHATLDLGVQPSSVAAQINEGDAYSPGGRDELTVTDVLFEPRDGGDRAVTVRVELTGEPDGDVVSYDGAPPRLGRDLDIVTDRYQVSGTVSDVGDGDAVPTTERGVVANGTVDAETASVVETGDEFTLRERAVGTVESVEVFGTETPDRKRVRVGLSLRARGQDGDAAFAGRALRTGTTVPFRTDAYALSLDVERVGTTEPRGDPAERTVTLRMEDVDPNLADALEPGMREVENGDAVAEVLEVNRENATVILEGEDGTLYERDHPRIDDLALTADLSVRETANGPTFKGERLQIGREIILDLGDLTVRATVASA